MRRPEPAAPGNEVAQGDRQYEIADALVRLRDHEMSAADPHLHIHPPLWARAWIVVFHAVWL